MFPRKGVNVNKDGDGSVEPTVGLTYEDVKIRAHIFQLKRRRDYLKEKLESGAWTTGLSFVVSEYEALDWVLKEMNK